MAGKRAISEEQKQARIAAIAEAAADLYTSQPYDSISMSAVAKAAGVAKGTVYLYFPSKEALFLEVLLQKFKAWFDHMNATLTQLEPPLTNEALAQILTDSVVGKSKLSQMLALGTFIFEHNIDYTTAHAYKQWLQEQVLHTGHLVEQRLPPLQPGQGAQILFRVYALVIGVENIAHPAPIIHQVQSEDDTLAQFDFEIEFYHMTLAVIRYSIANAQARHS